MKVLKYLLLLLAVFVCNSGSVLAQTISGNDLRISCYTGNRYRFYRASIYSNDPIKYIVILKYGYKVVKTHSIDYVSGNCQIEGKSLVEN